MDLVEERDGRLDLFEFKWSQSRLNSRTINAIEGHLGRAPTLISRDNYEPFVL